MVERCSVLASHVSQKECLGLEVVVTVFLRIRAICYSYSRHCFLHNIAEKCSSLTKIPDIPALDTFWFVGLLSITGSWRLFLCFPGSPRSYHQWVHTVKVRTGFPRFFFARSSGGGFRAARACCFLAVFEMSVYFLTFQNVCPMLPVCWYL